MALDYEEMTRKMKEFAESDEGKAFHREYFGKLKKKQDIQEGRYRRFEEWLKHNDFDKLMYRLILEHGEDWREKCWSKGYEVYMNNKLAFLFDYVAHNYEPMRVPQLENMFSTQIWFFKGYYFRIMHGQGSVVDVYNGEDMRHLLSA